MRGLTVRVSLSNLFQELKCTSTWLQVPFVSPDTAGDDKENVGRGGGGGGRGGSGRGGGRGRGQGGGGEGRGGERREGRDRNVKGIVQESTTLGDSSKSPRWTLLVLDLHSILTKYLNAQFAYVKNIKLCANLLVKGVFLSSVEYSPFTDNSGQQLEQHPLPRDMMFPTAKSGHFSESYDYIRFPATDCDDFSSDGKSQPRREVPSRRPGGKFVCSGRSEGVGGEGEGWRRAGETRGEKNRRQTNKSGAVRNCVYLPLFLSHFSFHLSFFSVHFHFPFFLFLTFFLHLSFYFFSLFHLHFHLPFF